MNKEKNSTDIATIGERLWWEKVTYQVIKHELKSVPSLYHAKHLLEILVKHNLCLIFSFDGDYIVFLQTFLKKVLSF